MKKIAFILVMMLCVYCLSAQVSSSSLPIKRGGTDNLIIETMIKPVLCEVRQGYQVKDSAKTYNQKGKDNFNDVYSIAIKVENGILVSDKVFTPWNSDPQFDKYRNYFTPVLSKSSIRPFGRIDMDYKDFSLTPMTELASNLFYVCQTKGQGNGLELDNSKGRKKGYMVWIVTPDTIALDSLEIVVSPEEIDIQNDFIYDVSDPMKNNIKNIMLGSGGKFRVAGYFVVPSFSKIGTMTLKLCGVAVQDKGEWRVRTSLIVGNVAQAKKPILEPTEPPQVEETPILEPAPDSGVKDNHTNHEYSPEDRIGADSGKPAPKKNTKRTPQNKK